MANKHTTEQLLLKKVAKHIKGNIDINLYGVKQVKSIRSTTSDTQAYIYRKDGTGTSDTKVQYTRVNIAEKYPNTLLLKPKDYHNTGELLGALNEAYDLNLRPSDVVEETIDDLQFVVLRMSDGNPYYKGALKIRLMDITQSMGYIFGDSINLPTLSEKQEPDAKYLFRTLDFSFAKRYLSGLTVGMSVDDTLLEFINSISSNRWMLCDNRSVFNLRGAVVSYNGPVKEDDGLYGKRSHVVRLNLHPKMITNLKGRLEFYYDAA